MSKEDNKDIIEQQNKGLQRSIYWNEYKTKEIKENADANVFKYINLDPSFQGVNRLFVMASNRANGQPTRNEQNKKFIYQELTYKNIMLLLMEEIFMIIQLKVILKNIENYTKGSFLDFNYFNKHYKLVAVDLSKQKELDADQSAIQQIEFKYMLGTNSTIYWVLKKSIETILEFYKGTVKVY